VNLFKFV